MSTPFHRRHFMKGALATGALAGLGDFAFLNRLPPINAAEGAVAPATVQFGADVEPLVRLIEDTPREKILEAGLDKVREGTSYQRMLSAVFLAGVRNIQPRPVGFEFHCVLAVHAAHLAALAAPDADRWLSLFWALDEFKQSQAVKKNKGAWTMPVLEEGKLPSADRAGKSFVEAMDAWDEEPADRAVAALVRSEGAGALFEAFTRYGARDFRVIGHKAIYVANAFRTLNTIGWRHAEPVLRSVAFALLAHEAANPAKEDLEPDRPWRDNLKRAAKIRGGWQRGKIAPEAAADLLAAERTASWGDAADKVVELLNKEIDPASVWDGLFLAAGELLMRQPGIVSLHSVTTTNALHYAYLTSGDDETRRMLMLQGAAFVVMFRQAMKLGDKVGVKIDSLDKADLKTDGAAAVEEVFADVSKDRPAAARKALALVEGRGAEGAEALLAAGRRLVFNKGRDAHDYKFSSAAMEDYYHVTPHWRGRYLASSMFWLHGSGDKDNELIGRARAALGKV
jgi:TAT (twin-arginine translocation) pathway signal sequence